MEAITFLRNVGLHNIYTAPNPRRRHSSCKESSSLFSMCLMNSNARTPESIKRNSVLFPRSRKESVCNSTINFSAMETCRSNYVFSATWISFQCHNAVLNYISRSSAAICTYVAHCVCSVLRLISCRFNITSENHISKYTWSGFTHSAVYTPSVCSYTSPRVFMLAYYCTVVLLFN
jgi:hypothetical protein